jgi:hypothetical protein
VQVRAKLWDQETWFPMPGAPVTLQLGDETVTLTTDAAGEIATVLPMPAGGATLSGDFADSRTHIGSADDDVLTNVQKPPGDVLFGRSVRDRRRGRERRGFLRHLLGIAVEPCQRLRPGPRRFVHGLPERRGRRPHVR